MKIHKILQLKIFVKKLGLILTSRYEGLPISIVEAMFAKRFNNCNNVSGNTNY